MRPLVDGQARRQARTDFSRSMTVEAAAGTGKTEALADRALAAVAYGHGRMSRVVAITFTRKAAGELMVRLRTKLASALVQARDPARVSALRDHLDIGREDVSDEELGSRIRVGLEEIEEAKISTIHSFCEGLLREEPFAVGLDPAFRVAEETESSMLFEEAWQGWLDEAYQNPQGPLPMLLRTTAHSPDLPPMAPYPWGLRAIKESDVKFAAIALKKALGQSPEPLILDSGEFTKFTNILIGWVQYAITQISPVLPTSMNDTKDKLYGGLVEALGLLRRASMAGSWLEMLSFLTQVSLPHKNYGRSENWRSQDQLFAARNVASSLNTKLREAVRQGRETGCALLNGPALEKATSMAQQIVASYEGLKKARALVDFDDLLVKVRDLLRDPLVRQSLSERFDLILVDECQDVDPLQLEIVLALTGEGDVQGDDYRPTPGRLFYVGDPKQSIFRFRRAHIGAYARARDRVSGEENPTILLKQNFRSNPSICRAVNRCFVSGLDGSEHQARWVPLNPTRPDNGTAVLGISIPRRWLGVEQGAGPQAQIDLEELRNAEMAGAASFLCDLRDGVVDMSVQDRETGEFRPARLGDVVVLLHRFGRPWGYGASHVQRLERWLTSLDVAHVTIGGRSYFSRPEVLAAHTLLRAIDEPYDQEAVVATLRGPVAAVPDEALLGWKLAGGFFNPLNPTLPGDLTEDHPVAAALSQLRFLRELALDRSNTVRTAVARVLKASQLLQVSAVQRHGDSRVANLLKVIELAATAESAGVRSLRGFTKFLGERIDQETAEPDLLLDPSLCQDAVRIMTVHKAKGLDAPIVVLLDWFRDMSKNFSEFAVRDSEDKLLLRVGPLEPPGFRAASEVEKDRLRAEWVRLGYVAATRARDWLVSTVYPPEIDRERAGPLAPLTPLFGPAVAMSESMETMVDGVTVRLHSPRRQDLDMSRLPRPAPQSPPEDEQGQGSSLGQSPTSQWRAWYGDAALGGMASEVPRPTRSLEPEEIEFPPIALEVSEPPPGLVLPKLHRDERSDRRGVLVHKLLERADLSPLAKGRDRLRASREVAAFKSKLAFAQVRREGWEQEEAYKILDLMIRLLTTPIMAEIAKAPSVQHEVPFVLKTPSPQDEVTRLVEGVIDVVFRDRRGMWWVVDFKTGLARAERLTELHGDQLRTYARALSEHLGGETVSACLVSPYSSESPQNSYEDLGPLFKGVV